MNKIQYIKNILLTFMIIASSLFVYDNVYAESDSEQVPQCTYQINQTIDGRNVIGNFTVAYYKNDVTLWNTAKNKKVSSISIGDSQNVAKASLASDGKTLFKEKGTSFSCPSSVQVKLATSGRGASRRYTFKITSKSSDSNYTASLSSDNSVVKTVEDGKYNAGNKLYACSSTQLNNLKNELDTNFTDNLNTPVYSKLKELSDLGKYSTASNGQPVLTTVNVVQSKTSEIINYYNLLLTGNYGNKKQEIIEKYRNSCIFENDASPLTYIKNRENQLKLGIKNIGKNKASQAKTWMQEENIDAETIREQEDIYDKKVNNYLNNLDSSMTKNDNNINNAMNQISNSQQVVPVNCGMLSEIIPYLQKVFNLIKIIVPIALICFGIIDFTTPILSNDKEALNKAASRFIKRCIIGIIVFFVPTLVNILLNIYNDVSGYDASTCGLATIVINYRR